MAKTAISHKRAKSWSGKPLKLRPGHLSRPFDPTIELRDPKFIRTAILQGLALGDFEGVVATYRAHLRVLNRTRSAKTLHVSRQSIHKMLRPNGNPSLKTFTAFMKFLEDSIPA
jgi:DNA-binding phage protein